MPPFTNNLDNSMDYLKHIPEIKQLLESADDAGVKTVDTRDDQERFPVEIFSCRSAAPP